MNGPPNPIANALWRIASTATRMAQEWDSGEHVPNHCDPDPVMDACVAKLAEWIVEEGQ